MRITEPSTERSYLEIQYGTTERLQVRSETHQRYSERIDDWVPWCMDRLDPHAGDLVLDVGCGTGGFHAELCRRGVRAVLGLDSSPAMVDATQRQANEHGWPILSMPREVVQAHNRPCPSS